LNVFITGLAGAGKSSLVNSMMSCLAPFPRQVCAVGQSSSSHCTMNMAQLSPSSLPFVLHDTPGLDVRLSDQQVQVLIEQAMQGQLKKGCPRDAMHLPSSDYRTEGYNRELMAHCILFVISVLSLGLPETFRFFKVVKAEAVRRGIQVLIVLTKPDELDEQLGLHPDRAYQSELIDAMCKETARKAGIPESNLAVVVNYTSQRQKCKPLEQNLLLLWSLIHRACNDTLAVIGSGSVDIVPQSPPKRKRDDDDDPSTSNHPSTDNHASSLPVDGSPVSFSQDEPAFCQDEEILSRVFPPFSRPAKVQKIQPPVSSRV